MPSPDFLVLCQSAVEHGNLVSMLGAGITQVQAEMLPIGLPLTVVARFYWDPEEGDSPHVVAVRVEHPDGERLANLEVGVSPLRQEQVPPDRWHPRESRSQRIVLTLPLEVRREAAYQCTIVVDGTPLMSTPIEVTTRLPQL